MSILRNISKALALSFSLRPNVFFYAPHPINDIIKLINQFD